MKIRSNRTYRLAALRPPDGLWEVPAADPLGLRARTPMLAESNFFGSGSFFGSVHDDLGLLRLEESGRWKLGVRRTPEVGVLGALPSEHQVKLSEILTQEVS